MKSDVISLEQTKEVWRMTWPLFLNGLLLAYAGNFDVYIAGQLGSEPEASQAAIGIGSQIWFLFAIAASAIAASCVVLLSKASGACDHNLTKGLGKASLLLAFLFGLLNVLVALVAAPVLVSMQTTSHVVVEKVNAYLYLGLWSLLPFYLVTACGAIYLALGSPLIALINTTVFVVALTILEPVLCLGQQRFGISAHGIAGIGYAWLFSQTLSCITALIIARSFIIERQRSILKTSFLVIKDSFVGLVKLAYPLVLQDLSWFISVAIIFRLIGSTVEEKLSGSHHLIESAQATLAVGLKVDELFMAVFLYALISAARALISKGLGEGNFAGAGLLVRRFVKIGIVYGLCNALLYLVSADLIGKFLTNSCELGEFLRVIALGQPFIAVFYVLCGCLQAYGKTLDSMIITILAFVAIRLPLAWLMGQFWGTEGIWISFPVSCMVGCLMAYYWSRHLLQKV